AEGVRGECVDDWGGERGPGGPGRREVQRQPQLQACPAGDARLRWTGAAAHRCRALPPRCRFSPLHRAWSWPRRAIVRPCRSTPKRRSRRRLRRPAQRSPRSACRRARVGAPMHASAGRSHQIRRRSRENIPIEETCFHPVPTLAAGLSSSIHALEPAVDLALGLVLRHAVALLKPAAELHALTLNDVEIIAGELAPLLLNLAFELFPIAFDTIPIHRFAPVCFVPVLLRPCRRNVQRENPARQPKFRCANAGSNAVPFPQKTGA